jgi:hypothetical protein
VTTGTAIAWYTPASWRQLQAAAGDVLCSYNEYLRKTEAMIDEFAARGIAAEKVAVNVGHMAAWCKHHGYSISDGDARAAYGAMLAMHGGKLFYFDAPIDESGLLRKVQ